MVCDRLLGLFVSKVRTVTLAVYKLGRVMSIVLGCVVGNILWLG